MLNKKEKKDNRLRTKDDFQRVRRQGKRIRTEHFILNYCPNGLDHSRLGIIISKRHARLAVARNRIRRQVRQWFHQTSLACGHDYVIIACFGTDRRSKQELRQCLESLLQKLNARCKSHSLAV